MINVVEYLDYRKYILDFYKDRKAKTAFTWREFARLAEFSNPVYLKQVADGKYNLSQEAANRVAKAMDLVGSDSTYFKLLVSFSHAKNDKLRQSVFKKMQGIVADRKEAVLNSESYKFFKSWKYSAIREIASSLKNPKASEIAKLCYPEISASEASEALKLMCRLGLLVQDKDGRYHETSKVISMVDGLKQLASTNLQYDMGSLAIDAMRNLPFAERSMSGLTVGISEKAHDRILYEIAEFRKRITSIVVEDENVERVYRLNLQFFPLSKKIEEKI